MSNDVDPQLDRLAPATRLYANLLKELDTEDPETHVYVRVYVGCTSCEYGNMGVCCVCLRVCICEPVLTIVYLRVDERSCVHGYAHKYYLLL